MPDYSHFQTGAALVQAALAGETTRVPVSAQMHEFVAAQLKIPGEIFYTRPDLMVPAMLEAQTQYGLDVASLTFDVYNIEAEALGQRVIFTDANMADVDRSAPLVREHSDLARIKTPDFDSAGRFPKVIEMLALFKKLTGLEPTLSFCAPFSLAANLRGIERLLMDICADPDFARELFERVTEQVLAPWILYQKKHFPNAMKISGADATASVPIVNLDILRNWIVPYILRLREICGRAVSVANWVGESHLKNPEEMLELKLAVSGRSIRGQDPDVFALTPEFYKRFAEKHNAPLTLGVGAAFLTESTPGEIAARVREYVRVGRRGGRFALYLCNIGATTPPENLRAAVEAAHD
ncbi:MAG: uroporphyrinogen decarboxylase family protein [Chloroflexota bacterium]